MAQFAVAPNGNVAYIPEEPASLVFADRHGASRLVTGERRNFHHPLFSPDGRRLSLDFSSIEGRNVWILGLDQGTFTRATFDRDGHDATWTPDGRFLTYVAPVQRVGGVTLLLLRKRPGSAEPPDTLLQLPRPGVHRRSGSGTARGWSPPAPTSGADPAWRTRRSPRRSSMPASSGTAGAVPLEPLVASRFNEQYVGVSPDGRWISFVSDQSGRDEVYVRDLAGERDQVLVSLDGGSEPIWSPDGRELYYRETTQNDSVSRRGGDRDDAGARGDPPRAALLHRRHRRAPARTPTTTSLRTARRS